MKDAPTAFGKLPGQLVGAEDAMPDVPEQPAKPRRKLVRYYLVIGALATLNLLEAVIHVVYGPGCWGFQPGGKESMVVAVGLALTFVVVAVMSLTSSQRGLVLAKRLAGAVAGAAIIVTAYALRGWVMFTSMHNQGPENLLMLGALNVGVVCVVMTGLGKRNAEK